MSTGEDDRSTEDDRVMSQVEIYRCGTEMEVNRVIDELLGPAGIGAFVHDRTSHSLPSPGGMGSLFIAVASEDAAQARELLAQARTAGELGNDGGELIDAAS